jgi:hypothetical protein
LEKGVRIAKERLTGDIPLIPNQMAKVIALRRQRAETLENTQDVKQL